MTERLQQPSGSGRGTPRKRSRRPRGGVRPERTVPAPTGTGPTILGFPAEVPEDEDDAEPPVGTEVAADATELLVIRRTDPFAATALVLAGVAANVSLLLSWAPGEGPTGLSLVQRGGEALDSGVDVAARSGVWQPLVVVLSGGLLVLLGLLLLVPARAHRLVGVLALVLALAAAVAVTVLMADSGLSDDRLGPGMWCAVAEPVLGALGALKAMLTAPLVMLGPR